MNPTPHQLTYLALMMVQLKLDFRSALGMASLTARPDSLWQLSLRDAIALMHSLEEEKRRRGYPQLHLT